MKTPIQELIYELEGFKKLKMLSQGNIHDIEICIEQCKMKLEKEKQQIIDANHTIYNSRYKEFTNVQLYLKDEDTGKFQGELYYEQTFNNNENTKPE